MEPPAQSVPGDSSFERAASRPLVAIAILLMFVVGAVALAFVRLPHADEGHFANCAWEFAHNGRLATPMWTEWLPSTDRYMYFTMPLYFVQLGIVSKVIGYEIAALRLDSVAWGIVLVLSWYYIVAGLTRDRFLAVLAFLLITMNYDVQNMASGRYDPMCAALNAAGIACYVRWRGQHLPRAVFLCNCLLAASSVTHPYALFGLVGFILLFCMLDRHSTSGRLLLLAALPYAVAFGAWGLYIAQNPSEFARQLSANASGRLSPLRHPFEAVLSDLTIRYLNLFAGFRPGVPIYMRIKILLLLGYSAAFVGSVATRRIRHDKGRLALVVCALTFALMLTFFEGTRWYIYLIHVLPSYSIVAAVWAADLIQRGGLWRRAVLAAIALFCLYSVLTVGYRVYLNDYGRLYEPTMAFLAKNIRGHDLVMAPAEFGPRLGFRQHCLADPTLGYRNALRPDYVVLDRNDENLIAEYRQLNPSLYNHVRQVLTQSELIFEKEQGPNYYRVYRVRQDRSTTP